MNQFYQQGFLGVAGGLYQQLGNSYTSGTNEANLMAQIQAQAFRCNTKPAIEVPPAAVAGAQKKDSAVAWLDRRVDELRVRL